jgi:sialic acid synthase SpsE/RimJ/RimL family protein N-acetyltransferase
MTDSTLKLQLITKTADDEQLLYSWRMEPQARLMSVHQEPMTPREFSEYFLKFYYLKDLPPFFVTVLGKPVAFVGFDPCDGTKKAARISILVAPERRGKGIGAKALEMALDFAKRQGYEELFAEIKPENGPSIAIFKKCGFEFQRNITHVDGGQAVEVLLFRKDLADALIQNRVCIIAEAGSNWRAGSASRDEKMAKSLILAAKDAGCDIVKFQTFKPETIYAPNSGQSDYLACRGIEEDMHTLFQDLAMPYEMIPVLAKYCDEVGIEFLSTPFSREDFLAVDPFVKRHKIASYELSHIHLLELAAKSKKPTYASTGAATLQEIAWAVSFYKQSGGSDLTLLHCSAQYPAEPKAMNVRAVEELRRIFGLPTGLSDHSSDPITAPVLAVALGAVVIEKHFTLSRKLPGPDHAFALEPHELKMLVESIRTAEEMRGNGYKKIQKQEEELYQFAKRKIQALREILPGEVFEEGKNIAILRPGGQKMGVHPGLLYEIVGKKATRAIEKGEGVQYGDWE